MNIDLYSPKQAHEAIIQAWKAVKPGLEAGKKYTLTIAEQKRSVEQNDKYHAIINEIADQAKHLGASWDAYSWKRLLVHKFCREVGLPAGRVIPSLDGSDIVQLDFQTRRFTKEQASQFVEWLHAWCADNGVTLKDDQ